MTKYVFFNVPGHGHVNPTLAIVRELVKRGENVVYYLTEEFRLAIEATGATFRAYQANPFEGMNAAAAAMANARPNPQGMLPLRMVSLSVEMLPALLESTRTEQADYIVYDSLFFPARFVAQILHTPAIALRPSYAMNEHVNLFARLGQRLPGMQEAMATLAPKLAQLSTTYDLPPLDMRSIMTYTEPLNIVFLPRAFQPEGNTFDERFVFVGPSFEDPRDTSDDFTLTPLEPGQSRLYISLGTVFNAQADFFNTCFTAFGDTNWQVVLSLGKNVERTALNTIPQNFIAAAHLPQLKVLANTQVFVSHGGMNSTMESLYYGVPLVVIPQMMEQELTARHVQELGLGIFLDRSTVTAETLREAVERVARNQEFHTRTQEMQKIVHASGGYQQAVEAIINYGRAKVQH